MKYTDRLIVGSVLLFGLGMGLDANACSIANWSSSSGPVTPDSPSPVGDTSRVEELCGLKVTGDGYVQDNSPLDAEDTRIRARFYVIQSGGGTEVTIFRVFEDDAGSNEAFSVSFTPNSNKLTFKPFGGTPVDATLTTPVGNWHYVEVDWQAGVSLRFWVDASPNGTDDNPTGTAGAGTASNVGMVRLGAIGGLGGASRYGFDSYWANRSNPVGGLLIGDANGDGNLLGSDLIVIKNEILENGLATGQPDCTMDGNIFGSDLICTKTLILNQ